jgi:TrpR-related protein YerC/YecD
MPDPHNKSVKELCKILLLPETEKEMYHFLKDLCTPVELNALAERWQICRYLDKGLSYREINAKTGASLTTIGRVGRFMKDEPYKGYITLLEKIKDKEK